MNRSIKDYLVNLPLFADLNPQERRTLAAIVRLERYTTGSLLCREGDRPFSFFIICEGHVSLYKAGRAHDVRIHLGAVGPGSMLGQVPLIDAGPRPSTIVADDPVTTLECSRDDFDRLFRAGNSLALKVLDQVMQQLATRLRTANEQLNLLYAQQHESAPSVRDACVRIHRTIHNTQPVGLSITAHQAGVQETHR